MKHIVGYTLLIGLFLGCVWIIIGLIKEQKMFRQIIDDTYLYKTYYDLLRGNIKMHYLYEDTQLKDFPIQDTTGKEFMFSELMNEDYHIIFKYSAQNCSSCIENELKNLIEIADTIGRDKIIILGEHNSLRELRAFLSERQLKFKIFAILEDQNAPGILKQENMPFVCLINKDMKTRLLFIPAKEISNYSKMYYHIVKDRFF